MKAHNTYINKFRDRKAELRIYGGNGDLCNGVFRIPHSGYELLVIASNGGGWDHVSVSPCSRTRKTCPTWEEMCAIKDMFFDDNEIVIQYHPAKEDYVNDHPYCLHLWRPQHQEVPKPPIFFV